MALAKRAPLLVLDEPVSSLDPIARLEFMRDVMAATADTGLTVLIASHVVSELERLCDWLIVLTAGHVQLAGPVDDLLAAHSLLTVPRATRDAELPGRCIHRTDSDRHSTALIRADPAGLAALEHPGWQADPVGFEQLVLAYLQRPPARGGARRSCPGRGAARADHEGGNAMIWVSWRQHRSQAIACLGLLGILAVFAIVVSTSMRTAFSHDQPRRMPRSQPGKRCLPGRGRRLHDQASTPWSTSGSGHCSWLLPGLHRGRHRRAADRQGTRIRHLAAGLEPDRSAHQMARHQAGRRHQRARASSASR